MLHQVIELICQDTTMPLFQISITISYPLTVLEGFSIEAELSILEALI